MPTVNEILANLNPQQKEAVTHERGPILVVAGAGTGKTTVITRRIAYLVINKLARPEEILALTFTDKASLEMEERVDVLVPYGYTETWISTFHAFGDRILRENALELGLSPNFRVLTRPEQIIFFRDHLFDFPLGYFRPLGDPTKYIEAILALISRAKDENTTGEEYLAYVKKSRTKKTKLTKEEKEELARQKEIAHTYKKYQELMSKEGYIDFGDQIILTLKLFLQHPSILKRYQEQFKYILIDEFQDTNFAQFELIKLLAEKHKNITVVGDDDQSIYKFRGAAISNILNFMKTYPKAKQIVLIRNYRSPQIILDTAYRLIKYNNPDRLEVKNNIRKRLQAEFPTGIAPLHLHYDTISSEADAVAKLICAKVKKGEYEYKNLAILVRSNDDADPFLRALNMLDIPWKFTGAQGLYTQEEIKLLLSFLRVVANLEDSLNLFYLATSEIYQFLPSDLNLISNTAKKKNRSIWWVFKNLDNLPELHTLGEQVTGESIVTIKKIITDLEKYTKMAVALPTGEVLYRFLTETGFLQTLTANQTLANEEKVKNIAKFFEIVRNTSNLLAHDRVAQFVAYLDMLIQAGDDPATAEVDTETNCVNVLTIHKAKGLEFPVVIMVSLVSDRFPTRFRREAIPLPEKLIKDILPSGDFHLQEERRLFYVGMTRAQKELYLTSARDYGGKRQKKVGLFVVEALNLSKQELTPYQVHPVEVISRYAPKSIPEIQELKPILENDLINLGPYHIDDYNTCPLKYKYIHILRVPIIQHHNVVYGSALHKTIEEYFTRKINGRRVRLDDLLQIFKSHWISEGFLSRTHEEQRFKQGAETLKRFYQTQEKEKLLPTYIEKEFNFILNNNKIAGRWDRVDVRGDKISIIDYKSSDVRTQEEANKRAQESLQLTVYALAYKYLFGKIPDWVGLYFLESQILGVYHETEEDLSKVIEVIKIVAHGIRQHHYQATPAYKACFYCAYNQICPSAITRPRY